MCWNNIEVHFKSVLNNEYLSNYVHHHISVLFYNLCFICIQPHIPIWRYCFLFIFVMICFLYTMMYLWDLESIKEFRVQLRVQSLYRLTYSLSSLRRHIYSLRWAGQNHISICVIPSYNVSTHPTIMETFLVSQKTITSRTGSVTSGVNGLISTLFKCHTWT